MSIRAGGAMLKPVPTHATWRLFLTLSRPGWRRAGGSAA